MKIRDKFPMMKLEEGAVFPFGWAIAYYDMSTLNAIISPFGIHFLVRWAYQIRYWWVRHMGRTPAFQKDVHKREREQYDRGREAGREEGIQHGIKYALTALGLDRVKRR